MGRPKKFNREDVLEKTMPLFWTRGFADTGMQDIEKVTGVNKSGLYSEFKDKEDIFLSSLRHYYAHNQSRALLSLEPLGWENVESFFKNISQRCSTDQKGCFGVASMREFSYLPPEAQEIVAESRVSLKKLFVKNIAAEKTKLPAETIADLLSTFLSGFSIEQNMKTAKPTLLRKVDDMMKVARGL